MKDFSIVYGFSVMLMAGISLQSCKPTPYRYYHLPPDARNEGEGPKILFMTFLIRQNDSVTTIELTDRKVTYGTLKHQLENSGAVGRIYVAQLKEDKTEIFGFYIEHPLRKKLEYMNDRNVLTTKLLEVKEAEFFIRTTLDPQGALVRLDEMHGDRVMNSFTFNIEL